MRTPADMLAIIFTVGVQVRAEKDRRRCFVSALAKWKDPNPHEGRRIYLSF